MSELYAQAGVNLGAGDSFSKFCYKLGKSTWLNCPFLHIEAGNGVEDYFRGDLGYRPINLPSGWLLDDAADGVGSKTIITVEALTPRQGASDLSAMALGDIVRKGGVPLKMANVLDVRTLGKSGSSTDHFFRMMMRGFQESASQERFVMYRGETAELGVCVGSENPNAEIAYNWAGFATGAKHADKRIDGSKLEPGQIVIAIQENGFRSNGISLVRKAFAARFGKEWWNNLDAKPFIKMAAEPSALWAHFIS